MSEDRDRLKGMDSEQEKDEDVVEAHRLKGATDDPESTDDDVEAHRLL